MLFFTVNMVAKHSCVYLHNNNNVISFVTDVPNVYHFVAAVVKLAVYIVFLYFC